MKKLFEVALGVAAIMFGLQVGNMLVAKMLGPRTTTATQ